MKRSSKPEFVMHLAVLPFYRQACMEVLVARLGDRITIFSGDRQLDGTVKTGVSPELFIPSRTFRLGSLLMAQVGGVFSAITAKVTVVDLNPRSISSWLIMGARKVRRRRTLAWGHLYPRAGSGSITAGLRLLMRRLASGTILYGYETVASAASDLPGQLTWVAPNSLYSSVDFDAVGMPRNEGRTNIIYVGRLEPSKKVDVLVAAFMAAELSDDTRLVLIGSGSQEEALRAMASSAPPGSRIDFCGAETDVRRLSEHYAVSRLSVSPGYVGLGLTQSLGFGVPMLISKDEPHSPELELSRFGGVAYFRTDDVSDLATKLTFSAEDFDGDAVQWAEKVRTYYSAEAMADGLISALENTQTRSEWA